MVFQPTKGEKSVGFCLVFLKKLNKYFSCKVLFSRKTLSK